MPIYIDYHHFPGLTVEKVKEAHMADLKVQEKYGVKYHQFWVNQEAGAVFCLIEGPNPEACQNVHREAHGDIACNIVEVETGLIDAFMGNDINLDHGMVYYKDGNIDTGFRFILIVDITAKTKQLNNTDLEQFKVPIDSRKEVFKTIKHFGGSQVKNISDDSIIAVFNDIDKAYQCSVTIQDALTEGIVCNHWNIEYRMALNKGLPVTSDKGFFEDAINFVKHLALLANNGEMILSKKDHKLVDYKFNKTTNVKVIDLDQEQFVKKLFNYTNKNLIEGEFTIKDISENMGVSRPQLYRKIKDLTGRSPVNFVRDVKMNMALCLVKENKLSISEIAYQLGYSNPSYFTKNFKSKYGMTPSKMLAVS